METDFQSISEYSCHSVKIKTASADLSDYFLHRYLSTTKREVIISTGMANMMEISKCLKFYKNYYHLYYLVNHSKHLHHAPAWLVYFDKVLYYKIVLFSSSVSTVANILGVLLIICSIKSLGSFIS